MNFVEIKPSAPLDKFIKSFWILEKEYSETLPYEPVYPDGCLDLVFSLVNNNLNSYFIGQQIKSIHIPIIGQAKFIGIQFFPYGAFPFFSIPMKEFTGLQVDSIHILGKTKIILEERIFSSSVRESISLLEDFLLKRLTIFFADTEQTIAAAKTIYLKKGNININQLAEDVSLTKRTLERKFETTIGLSPKSLANIFRFNKIKNELILNPLINLTSLGYRYGYFDQSHFIRDFNNVTALNPTAFVSLVSNKKIYFNKP